MLSTEIVSSLVTSSGIYKTLYQLNKGMPTHNFSCIHFGHYNYVAQFLYDELSSICFILSFATLLFRRLNAHICHS